MHCLLRLLLLSSTIAVLLLLTLHTRFYATLFIVGLILLFQLYSFLKYIETSNRMLSQTFESVLSDDFSSRLETRFDDGTFKEIGSNLNRVIEKFQKDRIEKEQQFEYLKTMFQQTGMGLMSVRSDGWINLFNKSARNILGISNVTNIQQLEEFYGEFSQKIVQMGDGEKQYHTIKGPNSTFQIAVYAQEIRHDGDQYRFFTLQNIQNEFEEIELEAWKNLIRVLSHEIMNSVTPISSLASTATLLLGKDSKVPSSNVEDLRQALNIINKRSRGLMQFVQNYRRFSQVPAPVKQIVPVASIFSRLTKLIAPELKARSIQLKSSVEPENLLLNIDPNQIEQVLLNLLKNSIEALDETPNPEIELSSKRNSRANVIIEVKDNGRGIHQDVLPQIFIPFFTTRSEGSGIGLSLSRQILRLHGGTIRATSIPQEQTVFSLVFS